MVAVSARWLRSEPCEGSKWSRSPIGSTRLRLKGEGENNNGVAGGGGVSSSAGYALHGTAGQPAAGVLSSSDYVLGGGFWGGGEVVGGTGGVYLPILLRQAR